MVSPDSKYQYQMSMPVRYRLPYTLCSVPQCVAKICFNTFYFGLLALYIFFPVHPTDKKALDTSYSFLRHVLKITRVVQSTTYYRPVFARLKKDFG